MRGRAPKTKPRAQLLTINAVDESRKKEKNVINVHRNLLLFLSSFRGVCIINQVPTKLISGR
jgi:hypothetical protein